MHLAKPCCNKNLVGFYLFIVQKRVHLWGSRKPYRVGKDLIFTNMKKLMYGGVAIASLMTVIVACQKENVVPNPTTMAATQKTAASFDSPQEKTGGGSLRFWHDNGGDVEGEASGADYGCWDEGGNCLPTTTVGPSKIANVNTFGNAVLAGNAASDIALFGAHKTFLLTFMSSADFNNVINGVYTVDIRGVASTSSHMYILLQNATGVQAAYPIGA